MPEGMKKTTYKVITPIDTKSGRTYWMRIGSAYDNVDGSTNIYLDAYPKNGRIQLRRIQEDRRTALFAGVKV